MYKIIDEKINQYNKIIIHRHKNPDMDAIGSQMGLYHLIKENYPNKEIYAVGDSNKFDRFNEMANISDDTYKDALVFIVDVAVSHLISDDRYELANEVIIIDHHENEPNINYFKAFINTEYSSAAEYIADIFKELGYTFNKEAASYLYAGMVTDTGRFMWMKKPEQVFEIASFLTKHGAETTNLYNWLYTESLESKKMKSYFQSKIIYEDGIAYQKNDKDVFELFDVDFFTVSRGMVNLASGIEEIKIWLNFTYNEKEEHVIGEFRSRGINIVEVAKSFGGGGHLNACGATLKDFAEADLVIQAYKQLLKEVEENEEK